MSRLLFALALIVLLNSTTSAESLLDASALYERVKGSTCSIVTFDQRNEELGLGSGVLISNDGDIVTNEHVIAGAARVTYKCGDVRGEARNVKASLDGLDLVVLNTNYNNSPSVEINTSNIKNGSVVFMIGNPFGLDATISSGLVNSKRTFENTEYIQLSANINPGNSGGAVLDQTGKLVGIATLRRSNAQGIGFAIPVSYITKLTKTEKQFSELIPPPQYSGHIKPTLSKLEFRGIPLGSRCSSIMRLGERNSLGDIELSHSVTGSWFEKHTKSNGLNYVKSELLDVTVIIFFDCADGVVFSAGYILYSKIEEILLALETKYGKGEGSIKTSIDEYGNTEYTGKVSWHYGNKLEITLASEKELWSKHQKLTYTDHALKDALQEKARLKLIESNEL